MILYDASYIWHVASKEIVAGKGGVSIRPVLVTQPNLLITPHN